MLTPQDSKQLHALCYQHHIKMSMTVVLTQTEYACPEPDCGVCYSPSNGYFIAPQHGQLESYQTLRVTCPRDGQPMYLAETKPEKGPSACGDARNAIRAGLTKKA
jgi:hypothetical protein